MDADEIIKLVRQGVDFGAMAEIRTLIDEIMRLRAELEAVNDDDEDGGFDYKFVVNEIGAASERAEQQRQEAREKTRLFWEQHEREHPRDENGEWK